jgi:hypothetical protein
LWPIDRFADFVIGRRFASTRKSQKGCSFFQQSMKERKALASASVFELVGFHGRPRASSPVQQKFLICGAIALKLGRGYAELPSSIFLEFDQ